MPVVAAAALKPFHQQIPTLMAVLAVVATLQMPVALLDQSTRVAVAAVVDMQLIAAAQADQVL
jgi:hypothetical protein